MKIFKTFLFVFFACVTLSSCDNEDIDTSSKASVKVTNVQYVNKVGTRCNVKVTVAVSGLAAGETVKTIGAKVGTSKSNPTLRDSRSGKKSATMTFSIRSNVKYYIIPFFKTNLTDGEVEGPVKTYKAS